MKKIEAYREAGNLGAGFLANVILNCHRNPAKKLNGLVELLKAGNRVRTAQFSTDILVVNDVQMGWEILEAPGLILNGTWRPKTYPVTMNGKKVNVTVPEYY